MKYLYLLICICFISCSEIKTKEQKCPELSQKEVDEFVNEEAELFSIQIFEDHKRILLSNHSDQHDEYILSNSNCSAKHIKFPLEKVVVLSSPHLGMIEALGKTDKVIAIGNEYLTVNPKLKGIKKVGEGETIDIENVILLEPDAILCNKIQTPPSAYKKIREAGIPIIECSEYLEKTPLAQAEWIKFFGVLFNENGKADSIYNAVSRDYNRLKILAQKEAKPRVFFNKKYRDIWYMPSGEHLASYLLRDANATYEWIHKPETGSLELSFETVIEHCLEDDIWINPGCATLEELINEDNRYTEFQAYKSSMIFDRNKQRAYNGANGYFETGALNCNLVLQDLIKIFHPNLFQDMPFTYYEKLK